MEIPTLFEYHHQDKMVHHHRIFTTEIPRHKRLTFKYIFEISIKSITTDNVVRQFFFHLSIAGKSTLVLEVAPCQWSMADCWPRSLKNNCIIKVPVNSSTPGQNGCHFSDNHFRCVFMNDLFSILIKIPLKFVPKGPIDNNPALV